MTMTTNAKIKIIYKLDENGRRASLLAGGDGRMLQVVEVPATVELLEIATITSDGSAWIATTYLNREDGCAVGYPGASLENTYWGGPPSLYKQFFAHLTGVSEAGFPSLYLSMPPTDPAAWALSIAADNQKRKEEAEAAFKADEARRQQAREAEAQKERAIVADWRAGGFSGRLYETSAVLYFSKGSGQTVSSLEHAELEALRPLVEERNAAEARREAEAEAAKQAALEAARAEMIFWIRDHGSERLKKAVEANVENQCRGVYRDERLALELPGWQWLDDDAEISDARNPSEAALDALLEARRSQGEKVKLCKVRESCDENLDEEAEDNPWREALVSSVGWAPRRVMCFVPESHLSRMRPPLSI